MFPLLLWLLVVGEGIHEIVVESMMLMLYVLWGLLMVIMVRVWKRLLPIEAILHTRLSLAHQIFINPFHDFLLEQHRITGTGAVLLLVKLLRSCVVDNFTLLMMMMVVVIVNHLVAATVGVFSLD